MRVCFSALVLAVMLAGCTRSFGPRPYPDPGAAALLEHLTNLRTRVVSLRAETRSDARIGDERANVDVTIVATWGGKLRYQAMNPGGSSMAADLASNGEQICFIDANHNCGGCGPATPENVGRLVRVPLEPDQVVAVMMGGTPLIEAARTKLEWDEKTGHEILTLASADGHVQRVVVDGRDRRWDLLVSELKDPAGKLLWRIKHKDFRAVARPDGGAPLRLPGASLFEQPGDVVKIDWREQRLDTPIDEQVLFNIEVPAGLPACG
jgi:hypothetical protein